MQEKNKRCLNCGNYQAYYEKCFCEFSRTDKGMCREKREILDKNGICEHWKSKKILRARRKAVALRALNDIISDIKALRQIFQEEKEEYEAVKALQGDGEGVSSRTAENGK